MENGITAINGLLPGPGHARIALDDLQGACPLALETLIGQPRSLPRHRQHVITSSQPVGHDPTPNGPTGTRDEDLHRHSSCRAV